MRRWQRLIPLLLVIVLATSLVAACAKEEPTPTPALAQPTATPTPGKAIKLKLGHYFATTDFRHLNLMRFVDTVNERGKGRLEIEVFPANSLVKDTEMLDALRTGAIEMGFLQAAYFTETALEAFGQTPLLCDVNNFIDIYQGGAADIMDKHLQGTFNIKGFMTHADGAVQVYSRVPIKKWEDLKGLMMRAPGRYIAACFERAGAGMVKLTAAEQYTAFQRGTVDFTYTSTASYMGFRLYEVAKYGLLPTMTSSANFFACNLDVWNKLGKENQDLILKAAKEWEDWLKMELPKQVEQSIKEEQEKGMVLYSLPSDEVARWRSFMEPGWEVWKKDAGPDAEKVLEIARKYWK